MKTPVLVLLLFVPLAFVTPPGACAAGITVAATPPSPLDDSRIAPYFLGHNMSWAFDGS